MAGITKWGLCPAPGRPGRIASQEVDSAYCGSRCQQLTVSEHLAVACSLTCTRYKAALRRRFAQAHGTSSGSGPRRLGTEAQMRFFRPETRGHPQGLGAPSDHRWRGAVSGGAERSQAEGGDQRPGLSIRQAAPAAAAFMLHSYAPRQSGSGSKSLTGRLAVHCQASKSLTGSIAESPCRPGQGAINHSSGLRHARTAQSGTGSLASLLLRIIAAAPGPGHRPRQPSGGGGHCSLPHRDSQTSGSCRVTAQWHSGLPNRHRVRRHPSPSRRLC